MPRSAADNFKIDYCLPLSEIGPLLVRLANDPGEEETDQEVTSERESTLREAEKRVQLIQQVLNHGAK